MTLGLDKGLFIIKTGRANKISAHKSYTLVIIVIL